MSPSQTGNRGVPETIHLTERSFDETLAATRGLVSSIPTIMFFNEGAVVDRVVGAAPKALLQDIVNGRA